MLIHQASVLGYLYFDLSMGEKVRLYRAVGLDIPNLVYEGLQMLVRHLAIDKPPWFIVLPQVVA